jgi:hypothetical protein
MIVGSCPKCKSNVILEKKTIQGKNVKVYRCEKNVVTTLDGGETWELKDEHCCDFKIFGNALKRYGKRGIGIGEVKRMLQEKDVAVRLYSFNKKCEYYKYIRVSYEYGVEVDWETEVEEKLQVS